MERNEKELSIAHSWDETTERYAQRNDISDAKTPKSFSRRKQKQKQKKKRQMRTFIKCSAKRLDHNPWREDIVKLCVVHTEMQFCCLFLFPAVDLTECPQIRVLRSLLCALTNMYRSHGCPVMWKSWRRFYGCDSNPHFRYFCSVIRVNFNFLIWVLFLVKDSVILWYWRGKQPYSG